MTATFTHAIQYIDEAKSEAQAAEMLAFLATQADYRGGRILPAVDDIPWRVQVFFEDVPDAQWLPDGCRRVIALTRMMNAHHGIAAGQPI